MKIKNQILIWILSTTIVIFAGAIGYIVMKTKQLAFEDATKLTDAYSLQYANHIKAELTSHLGFVSSLANSLIGFDDLTVEQRRRLYSEMLQKNFIENPGYLSVWAIWEKGYFDPEYTEAFGSERTAVHEFSGKIDIVQEDLFLEGDNPESIYYTVKMSAEEAISLPEFISYDPRVADEFITKISVPIIEEGNFVGCAGVDVKLSHFQTIINSIQPFRQAYAILLANDGTIIAHPKQSNIGKKITKLKPYYDEDFNVAAKLKAGENFSTLEYKVNQYTSYAPIFIGKTKLPWSLGIVVPIEEIMENANQSFSVSIIISIVGVILLIIVILYVSQRISNSLLQTTNVLTKLSVGDISESNKMFVKQGESEIEQIKGSVNHLIDGLNRIAVFAKKIGRGKLESSYQLLSQHDILGNALLDMRENLTHAREDEAQRKLDDAKRNWATQGLAELGEILRQNRGDIEEFSTNIIRNLTKYISANQGGLFVINDDNPNDVYIQLVAAYAYDKEKMLQKRINLGRGLIGRCILEKRTINMTEIPQNYISITSGLGESTPQNLLIVPLIFDDTVYGVLELASFKKFENYQVDFVEKFGESVAASISNIKINLRTARLLEESNKKSEELALQEKEMRQNVLELQSAQEESARKEIELTGILNSIASISTITQYDINGKILNINGPYLDGSNYYKRTMEGRYHRDYARESVENPKEYRQFWNDLLSGKSRDRIVSIQQDDFQQWISERYTPVKDENGKVYKIINIGTDITESKILENRLLEQRNELLSSEEELRQNLEELQSTQEEIIKRNREIESLSTAVDRALMRAEYSTEGFISDANEKYATALEYATDEIIGQHYSLFVPEEDRTMTNKIWKALNQGKTYQGQMKRISKVGEIKWFLLSYTPEVNELEVVSKIYLLGYDITESKNLELEVSNQAKELAQHEEGLRQTLEMFQATQEEMALQAAQNESLIEALNTSSLVVELDPYGIIFKVNDEFAKLLGKSKEEFAGKKYDNIDLLAIEDKEKYEAFWEELRTGKVKKKTTKLNIEEVDIWLQESYSPLVDENNNVVKILNIASNITSSKRQAEKLKIQTEDLQATEEELRQNLEELQTTQDEIEKKNLEIESLNIAVDKALMRAEYNIEGEIIDVNQRFVDALGYKVGELVGKAHKSLFNVDNEDEAVKIWHSIINDRSFQGEILVETKNGDEKWFLLTYIPEIDDDNHILKIFSLGYDITESKNLEIEVRNQANELKQQEEGLIQTLEEFQATQEEMMRESVTNSSKIEAVNATLLVCQFNTEGMIFHVNNKFADLLNIQIDDLMGLSFADFYKNADNRVDFEKLTNELKTNKKYINLTEINVNDKTVYVYEHFYPVYNIKGEIDNILNLAIDITEKKNAEFKLEELSKDIEQKHIEIEELKKNLKRN